MSAVALLLLASAAGGLAEEAPTTARGWLTLADKHYGNRKFADALKALDRCLALEKNNARGLQLRGCAHFMLGKFKESVADFDAFIKLRPAEADGHWQRGISLYYAGKYADGMKQFNAYEKVDTKDVENAVWHFLCAAKKDGVAKARKGILKIGKDERVPMMKVYDLFKGTAKPADVLGEAKAGEVTDEMRKQQLFYAHLYVGLYYDVTGDAKKAKEHLGLAGGKYRISHYMGDVARVHHELLAKAKPKKK
jgi:lipoprotein NlpI